ncbi:HEAT repeat domain-containing protein [Halorubellus sp. PRR65]|uniref:HEAT repeat domain-containing protein n=1 Tax=Halorubellus sp. PRR65 TaxID=3098148 RepID=UPI002B25E7BB|nr:HEAT repeat domain-containing protein [Halorubellus sp. PRR65]
MQGDVGFGGYILPIETVLVVLGLLVGIGLVVSAGLTLGLSVYRHRRDERADRVRPDVQDALLERAFSPDPNWDDWIDTLSATERQVAEDLLAEYLRELDGSETDSLKELGAALGIPERARSDLERGHKFVRLQALTWLIRLDDPEPYRAASYGPETPPERASVARLLSQTGELISPRQGLELLLAGATEEFSVFGQDTLYRLASDDPDALFEIATEQYDAWPPALLTQVLLVCGQLGSAVRTADISWLTASLEADDEGVRAAAASALGGFGWRPDLRDSTFFARATDDPSPRVRGAVYEMLGAWGDHEALTLLVYALVSEDDPRALVRGTNALVSRRDRIDADEPAVLGSAWEWSSEHASYDGVARGRTRAVGE